MTDSPKTPAHKQVFTCTCTPHLTPDPIPFAPSPSPSLPNSSAPSHPRPMLHPTLWCRWQGRNQTADAVSLSDPDVDPEVKRTARARRAAEQIFEFLGPPPGPLAPPSTPPLPPPVPAPMPPFTAPPSVPPPPPRPTYRFPLSRRALSPLIFRPVLAPSSQSPAQQPIPRSHSARVG